MEREHVRCPVCDADNNGFLFHHFDECYTECETCGLIYINPRLRQDEVESFFEDEYYGLDRKKVEFSTRLRYFEEKIRSMESLKQKGRVLDIGCGPGHFLEMCRRAGWQPVGVELSAQACAAARAQGLDVAQGSLQQAAFADGEFDVVTLWNVLDHMTQPLDEMREVHRILKPGGLVLVRVPNAAFHRLVKAAVRRLNSLMNLNMADKTTFKMCTFSGASARRLFDRAGFRQVRIDNSAMSDINPWSIDRGYRVWLLRTFKMVVVLGFHLADAIGRRKMAPSIEIYATK